VGEPEPLAHAQRVLAYPLAGRAAVEPDSVEHRVDAPRRHALVAGDGGASAREEAARERLSTLSPREREVALAVGRGQANADIAAELHMSVATVKAHVSRLLTKLEAENRVQIALVMHDAAGA
jgi:DNA-binding NarL/FixJ family response regulator